MFGIIPVEMFFLPDKLLIVLFRLPLKHILKHGLQYGSFLCSENSPDFKFLPQPEPVLDPHLKHDLCHNLPTASTPSPFVTGSTHIGHLPF